MASITQRFLLPVSTVSTRNAWHNDLPFVSQKKRPKIPAGYFQKNWVGVCCTLPETLTLFHTKICDFSYPISDLIKNLIPRPEALEPGAWPERATSCYGMYTVVAVNIKREMVLSPNDEEVANSSEKRTRFKTRVHKPYPISDQNGRIQTKTAKKTIKPFCAAHTYIAYIRDCPPGRKTRCRLWISLLTQARLITHSDWLNLVTHIAWKVSFVLVASFCFRSYLRVPKKEDF